MLFDGCRHVPEEPQAQHQEEGLPAASLRLSGPGPEPEDNPKPDVGLSGQTGPGSPDRHEGPDAVPYLS